MTREITVTLIITSHDEEALDEAERAIGRALDDGSIQSLLGDDVGIGPEGDDGGNERIRCLSATSGSREI